MKTEILPSKRSTVLRKNKSQSLRITLDQKNLRNIMLISGTSFIFENLSDSDLIISPNDHYMIIYNGNNELKITYNQDVSNHDITYNPYKYENSEKVNFKANFFEEKYKIPEEYIETLPKWYSFKFTYPKYNLIFIKPELGFSIQTHQLRNETWEVIEGSPIIIINNKVYYNIKKGMRFQNPINSYHSIINPSKHSEDFVLLKETWSGTFDEKDIKRIFNPNKYLD